MNWELEWKSRIPFFCEVENCDSHVMNDKNCGLSEFDFLGQVYLMRDFYFNISLTWRIFSDILGEAT